MDLRPVRHPQDLQPLDELFAACRLADGHPPLGEHKYLDLVRGGGESTLGLVGEADGQVVAYGHLTWNERSRVWGVEVAVHPLFRHADLLERLFRRALEAAGETEEGEVRVWAYHPKVAEALRGLGFREDRELRQLRRPLPPAERPELPDGVQVRAFRPGVDEEAWLAVNNAAFAGHPEQGAWDRETLEERERQPWFDPEGFRMAWEGEELAGFCWTKLHPEEVGEIYVIAVAPGHQGRSLGEALALDGLWHLHDRGAREGMLYVDSSNDPALALYDKLGFHLDHVDRCFVARAG